jgi:hypothetical protein
LLSAIRYFPWSLTLRLLRIAAIKKPAEAGFFIFQSFAYLRQYQTRDRSRQHADQR